MEQVLREIIARIAEVPNDFPADARLRDDLDVDSYRTAEIVFEIERAFRTKLPDERLLAAATFNDMLSLLTTLAVA